MKNQKLVMVLMAAALVINHNSTAYARNFLYHATRKAIARKIASKGFSVRKMNPKARFGKGVYVSNKPCTALKEAPRGKTLVRSQASKRFQQGIVNMRRPTPKKVRALVPEKDLRGKMRKGFIGPVLGRKLGRYAGSKDKVIRYNSLKDPKGINYYVPRSLVKKHPRIINHLHVKEGNRYR